MYLAKRGVENLTGLWVNLKVTLTASSKQSVGAVQRKRLRVQVHHFPDKTTPKSNF